jgi:pimeloyl-ACP methyl ester carboxylesterase
MVPLFRHQAPTCSPSRSPSNLFVKVRIMFALIRLLIGAAASLVAPAVLAEPAPTMVTLSTGSEVATWTLAPEKQKHQTVVLFLHGGPGLYTEARRLDEGRPFRAAGFTTVYFDQVGGGKSKRLPASDYSLERAVADVEALRVKLGQDRLILWGNSFGTSLAAIYAARFPGRVAGLILTSPGTFPGTNPKRSYSLTNRDKVKLSKDLLAAAGKIDKAGGSAETKVSQDEAGKAFDAMVAAELIEGMVCKGAQISPPALAGGGNLFANRIILKQVERLAFKPQPMPKSPTLIIRGSCDFLPESNAAAYAKLFGASVTPIAGAGHGLLEKRGEVEAAFAAFAAEGLAGVE